MKKQLFLIFILIFTPVHLFAEDSGGIDDLRAKAVEKWSGTGFGDVNETLSYAKNILNDKNASIDELTTASTRANAAANFVGYITEEYDDYIRDNYQYDFVTNKVLPTFRLYQEKQNSLLNVRNEIFLRIGDMLKEQGKYTEAFFYYNDAFRLSIFETSDKGIRWKAEQEMKAMLGLNDIVSFITWQY